MNGMMRRVVPGIACLALLSAAGCLKEAGVRLRVHPDASAEMKVSYVADMSSMQGQLEGMAGMLGSPAPKKSKNPFDSGLPGEIPGELAMSFSVYLEDITRPDEKGKKLTLTKNADGSFALSGDLSEMNLKDAMQRANDMGGLGAMSGAQNPGGAGPDRTPNEHAAEQILEQMKFRFEIVMPGEVKKSSFPNVRGRSTWFEAKGSEEMKKLETIGALTVECGPATPEAVAELEQFKPVLEKARESAMKAKKAAGQKGPLKEEK